jgi:hydroxymethylpyrimidine pyrophosphatase-like HAD family hydrolase
MPRRLLALDLDGTLLRQDGGIEDRDAAAVRRALRLGVAVTLATGRLATGALPTARALGIESPLVCADGVLLACGRTGCVLEQEALDGFVVESTLCAAVEHALAPFVFRAGSIHADARCAPLRSLVRAWTEHIVLHDQLTAMEAAWRGEPVATAFAVGGREGVDAAARAVVGACGRWAAVATFALRDEAWALRVRPPGWDKARMLARLAERLDVTREHVCAVGDWLNDAPMLAWAGRAFAMSDAPEEVRLAARETVDARRGKGGGVAEAIGRWLGW